METLVVTPLDEVKRLLGGNVGIARALGNLTSQAVSQWRAVPVERAIELESKAGVSRHISRPDIFGPAPDTLNGAARDAEAGEGARPPASSPAAPIAEAAE